jgi:Transposase IS66 family/IS66 C-terminal element
MFPAMVLIAWRPPSLRRVPASPVPRPLRYYEAATTSRRACPSAYVFASGFRPGSIVRVRCRAPGDVRAHRLARSFVHPALQGPGLFRTGDDGTSQVPWRPLPRLCPALRPRPNRSRLAMSSRSMLPPDPTRRRLRRFHDFEAATGLQRPLSTLHERRCRRPCKTRFRLAGSAFAGRASNPPGRFERFQVTSILLSRAYPDASWAHTRRKFYEVAQAENTPLAHEALRRIASLYAVEAEVRGQSAPDRMAARRALSAPIVEAFKAWLEVQLSQLPSRGNLAEAVRYALARWRGLTRFLHDGRIELDTNPVERAIRPVALGRKNHLFAGSDGGGARWAIVCSLVETCKLNGVEPYAYLKDVLERMVDGYPVNRLDELLPWAWCAKDHVKS